MKDAISIEEARKRDGVRMILLEGFPSPWSQAAKGLFEIEGIAFTPVHRREGDPEDALQDWTGQNSYPAVVLDDEPARSGWAEILILAHRLAPEPSLIPSDPEQRARLFGYAHEICGEMGLGWCRRLQSIDAGLHSDPPNPMAVWLGGKYGHRPDSAAASGRRVVEVLNVLDGLLADSRARGGEYLMGEALSALDVYWATFCNLVDPLPPEQLPLSKSMRAMFTAREPETLAALTKPLLELRDRVYEQHLTLPVEL